VLGGGGGGGVGKRGGGGEWEGKEITNHFREKIPKRAKKTHRKNFELALSY